MTDREMIEWLKAHAADAWRLTGSAPDVLAEVAARLEQLAAPAAGSPIAEARLAEIRRDDRECGVLPPRPAMAAHHDRRDLLAAYDREQARADGAEAWCARLGNDRESETALRAAERAALAARLDETAAFYERMAGEGAVGQCHAFAGGSFRQLARQLRERGPAQLPPHEASLARLRRLEAALAWIAEHAMRAPGPSYEDLMTFAQKALEDAS